jgi:hypothetical protein
MAMPIGKYTQTALGASTIVRTLFFVDAAVA